MPNIIANTVGYDDFCQEHSFYKELIESNDFDAFQKAIKSELPKTNIVFQEAFKHDVAWADALIKAGYGIKDHSDLLYNAVGDIDVKRVKYLLAHGADINEVVKNGYTSMHPIGGLGKEGSEWDEMVKILLDNGGDPFAGGCHTASTIGAVFTQGSEELKRYYVDVIVQKGLLTYIDSTGCSIMDVPTKADASIKDYIVELLPNEKPYDLWSLRWAIESINVIPFELSYSKDNPFKTKKQKENFIQVMEDAMQEVYEDVAVWKKEPDKNELMITYEKLKQIQNEYGYDWSNYFKYIDRYLKNMED